MPRSSLVARQMAFRLPLLPLQASHRQQRWPTNTGFAFLRRSIRKSSWNIRTFWGNRIANRPLKSAAFWYRRISRDRGARRSEEHTSELQSLTNLVCRLLLEKKKNNIDHKKPIIHIIPLRLET